MAVHDGRVSVPGIALVQLITGSRAAAARINIRLYRQQFFESRDAAPDTDGDFFKS